MQPVRTIPGFTSSTTKALAIFCINHQVRFLRIYGSCARNELRPDSDIDILIEFNPGADPDLFQLGGMQQELSAIFDREVDLKTPDMLSPHILNQILASSILGYAA